MQIKTDLIFIFFICMWWFVYLPQRSSVVFLTFAGPIWKFWVKNMDVPKTYHILGQNCSNKIILIKFCIAIFCQQFVHQNFGPKSFLVQILDARLILIDIFLVHIWYSTHALIDTICWEKSVSIRENFRL